MIDLKALRENPQRFKAGAAAKRVTVDIDAILKIDSDLRAAQTSLQSLTSEKNSISKTIGALAGRLKKAAPAEKPALEAEMAALQKRPTEIKAAEADLTALVSGLETQRTLLLLHVPQPPDPDVPVGPDSSGNVEIRRWNPSWFDTSKSFSANKGFAPKSHLELGRTLNLFDFERGAKISGSRSYVLTGDGMRLQQAVMRFAFDFMVNENGFRAMSAPVLIREECMVGTGFFPAGREQAYQLNESTRSADHGSAPGYDLFLAGTGEVGLMAYHMDEILPAEKLPLKYVTVSDCFRREAGAAGKDTAGLYRIHHFQKVEQVVITRADEAESRQWHKTMIGFVETLLQRLEIPYRLLQCCTGDLGVKNADMIDIESWMPSRGEIGPDGLSRGDYGETHSASRLYDFQCRRLNTRYKDDSGRTVVCHSLNNTVAAGPRILIPILELNQNADGSITIPKPLRPYMNNQERIG